MGGSEEEEEFTAKNGKDTALFSIFKMDNKRLYIFYYIQQSIQIPRMCIVPINEIDFTLLPKVVPPKIHIGRRHVCETFCWKFNPLLECRYWCTFKYRFYRVWKHTCQFHKTKNATIFSSIKGKKTIFMVNFSMYRYALSFSGKYCTFNNKL